MSVLGCVVLAIVVTRTRYLKSNMVTDTPWRDHNGYIALLLLCVVLSTFGYTAMAKCSAAESAALLKFKSVLLDARGDLATWGPAGGNCCRWRVITLNNTSYSHKGTMSILFYFSLTLVLGSEACDLPLGSRPLQGIKCGTSGVEAIDLTLNAPARNNLVEVDLNNAEAGSIVGDALAKLPQLSSLRTDGLSWPALPLRQLSKVPLRELVIRNGGHLPSDIGTFGGTLERLVVSGTTYITGLPSSVCKLTKLKVLEVSSTGLPSLGPSCLGEITSLEEVRMQNNHKATGGLPVWPTTLPNLKVLDLSNNAHSGNIPVQYGKLGNVELHLGGNHLSSRIPPGLGNKPESTFRPGNEKLCGAPLAACLA